jgi:hypothetical protein
MPKVESYNELMFQLGDLARERLVNRPNPPRSLERVLRAEEVLLQRQQEVQDLEAQMNEQDAAFREFAEQAAAEKAEQELVVRRWKRAVDAIQGRVKDLRKKLAAARADLRYGQKALKIAEEKHGNFEMTAPEPAKLELSKQNLKKLRLQHMRAQRNTEEMEIQFNQVFAVAPGHPGAEGILAHKRILDLEDEEVARKDACEVALAELDQVIAQKEEETKAAEEYLDQATFLLAEECYADRVADPALAALYPRLDKAQ